MTEQESAAIVARMRAGHPPPADVLAHAGAREWGFSIAVRADVDRLWDVISDTSRFNRALGLGEMRFDEREGRLHGSNRSIGRAQTWVEEPWNWVRGRSLSSLRRYDRGWSIASYVAYELEPATDGGSNLLAYFVVVPRSAFGGFLLGLGMRWLVDRHRAVLGELDPRAAIARLPPPAAPELGPEVAARLAAFAEQLRERGIAATIVDELTTHVRDGDELDLDRIAPLELARRIGVDEVDFVTACLHATRIGMLDMRWDVVCPRCRGVRSSATRLGDVPAEGVCEVCDVEFSTSELHAVEITFRPHPSVRPIERRFYCSAEPATKKHVEVQVVVPAGGELAIATRLVQGRHRLRAQGRDEHRFVDVTDGTDAPDTIAIDVPGAGEPPIVTLPSPSLRFRAAPRDATRFVVETPDWSDSALRAGQLLGMQGFRDLFSEQTLATGMRLEVGTQTVVFTDVVGSTAFYTTHGDPTAFAIVKAHFDRLYSLVSEHRGVVVKTIGDATMTVFADPRDAVLVSQAIQRSFATEESPTDIRLRIAMHTGPCIVVQFHQGLDYFGGTVNLAAKLQSLASAGEVVISDATYSAPGVGELVDRCGGTVEEVTYRSAAFASPVSARRWTPTQEVGGS